MIKSCNESAPANPFEGVFGSENQDLVQCLTKTLFSNLTTFSATVVTNEQPRCTAWVGEGSQLEKSVKDDKITFSVPEKMTFFGNEESKTLEFTPILMKVKSVDFFSQKNGLNFSKLNQVYLRSVLEYQPIEFRMNAIQISSDNTTVTLSLETVKADATFIGCLMQYFSHSLGKEKLIGLLSQSQNGTVSASSSYAASSSSSN